MSARKRVRLPVVGSVHPRSEWRIARGLIQALAFVAVLVGPFLGGWQRVDRNYLAAWEGRGWDLPGWLLDVLPFGEAPARAHASNVVLGGGSTAEYFSIPFVDPMAGAIALTAGGVSTMLLISWGLSLLLGALLGRAFCGWLCPFGTLSRILLALQRRLPFHPRPKRIGTSRPLRWLVLVSSVAAGVTGFGLVSYLLLPHVLLQQSVYSLWLLGGGGAVMGWLVGLILAGLFLGPTVYCSTLCPTGSSLALLGRFKRIHIAIDDPQSCGSSCELCSRACWLHLDPASGDAGPDCDSCARCVRACPKNNLIIGAKSFGEPGKKVAQKSGNAAAFLALILLVWPGDALAQPEQIEIKPRLVMESWEKEGDVSLSLSAVDFHGVKLSADSARTEQGTEMSVLLYRGELAQADERGRLEARESYTGNLRLRVVRNGQEETAIERVEPNSPMSAARRAIYRDKIPGSLKPGDRVILDPIPGWVDKGFEWTVPQPSPGRGGWRLLRAALVSLLLFSGLISFGLGLSRDTEEKTVKAEQPQKA